MTEKCFDEGTIQAFLDGELETGMLEAVARHTVSCEACAFLLREAEQESSYAFSALGEDFNSLVPTERIRTNLYQEIARLENTRPTFWQRIFGGNFNFTNPSVAAFASLLMVFGIFVTLFVYRNANQTQTPLAQNEPRITTITQNPVLNPVAQSSSETAVASNKAEELETPEVISPRKSVPASDFVVQKAAYKPSVKSIEDRRGRNAGTSEMPERRASSQNELLPAEQSYVKTIATLTETVNARKTVVLRPSEQVAFEKNLAVVNQAISAMRQEVRKNPGNDAAKQILRSSYQNKIDLLNSVAEKQELMAIR